MQDAVPAKAQADIVVLLGCVMIEGKVFTARVADVDVTVDAIERICRNYLEYQNLMVGRPMPASVMLAMKYAVREIETGNPLPVFLDGITVRKIELYVREYFRKNRPMERYSLTLKQALSVFVENDVIRGWALENFTRDYSKRHRKGGRRYDADKWNLTWEVAYVLKCAGLPLTKAVPKRWAGGWVGNGGAFYRVLMILFVCLKIRVEDLRPYITFAVDSIRHN